MNRSHDDNHVDGFLAAVARRINLRTLMTTAVWTLAAAAAVMLLVALGYVSQGYAVERRWYWVAGGAAALATLVAWVVRLAGVEAAARAADRHFGLQDALVSLLHFRRDGKRDGFYALQEEQTAGRVAELDPHQIDWRPSGRPAFVAAALAAVALGMALIAPSQAVQERLALEDLTLTNTSLANEELKDLVQELNEQVADPLEREMIEPDKLREMVEALDETKDQKEALKQYAKLEQLLNQQLAKLQQKKDEHLLAEAAKELEKPRETKPLGEQLQGKKYEQAASELEQMEPEETKPLTEQQKQLAKLRAASKRMAAAVRNQRGRTSSGKPSQSAASGQLAQASSSAQSGKSGAAQGAGGAGGGELGEAIEQLDESLSEWDKSLTEAMQQKKQSGKIDAENLGECQACQNAALADLDKLAKYLKRMAIKKKAADKLGKLCKACSQCQGGLCQSPNAGGKKAGMGSSLAQRDERDELIDNGQTEALKGVKGQGPSQTTVETADEGTGTSSRGAVARKREFRKQYESFVSREDVPEEVRSGVKQYFESIHQIE